MKKSEKSIDMSLVDYYELRVKYKGGITRKEKYDTFQDLQDRFDTLLLTKKNKIQEYEALIVFTDGTYQPTLNKPNDRWTH